MANIYVNNANFYYELHGSGQALVLIAGYSGNAQSWMPIVDQLSKHFQILIFDNRGVGQTHDDDCELSIELMAHDVMMLCKALNLHKPHIVGRSMGGSIAQTIAATYPDQIDRIGILVSAAKWRKAVLMSVGTQIKMQEMNIDTIICNNSLLSWLLSEKSLNDYNFLQQFEAASKDNVSPQAIKGQKRQFRALEKFDGISQLHKISAPTFIGYGSEDIMALPQESKFMAKQIPHAKLAQFDCAHLILLEQTQKLINELVTFLV